jgi:DNA-binding CsgD family transcriptional regulator
MSMCGTAGDSDQSTRPAGGTSQTGSHRTLTPRQSEVLQGIALRKPIKQIAGDAGISESAVNQHIRVLKRIYQVNSLGQLAECYRQMETAQPEESCRKPICNDNQLFFGNEAGAESGQDKMQPVVAFNEPLAYESPPPWARQDSASHGLHLVPEVLNGRDANWVRTAAMVAVAIGTLLVLLIGLGVAQGLSSAFEAQHLPPQETKRPGV